MTRWLVGLVLGAVLGVVLAGATATVVDARPGGGHSYSGGSHSSSSYHGSSSHSSSSGGSSGDATSMAILVGLIFLVIVIIAVSRRDQPSTWTSAAPLRPVARTDFLPLLKQDPAFSQTAFEDFAFELYARAQRARGRAPELAALTPYLATDVLAALGRGTPIQQVVIGSLRTISVTATDQGQVVDVRIEANLAAASGTTNVIEMWTFRRFANVQTRAPEQTRTFPCPNCNAPFATGAGPRTCAHCGTELPPGKFDWTVTSAVLGSSNSVGLTLTGTVEEVGNDLITIVAGDAYQGMQDIYAADKNVSWDAFSARVTMTYARLNEGWNAQNLTPVRGLVTSSLLGYLQYWIDEYKRQKLVNTLGDAKLGRIALAKVQRDRYFDAVTVRVFADGFDYTTDADKRDVGGSRTKRRAYTEYWTFIRSSTRTGPVVTEPKCPNCGAPLSISDAGACTHCQAVVETGSFDWVLSKIEQDEVYTG